MQIHFGVLQVDAENSATGLLTDTTNSDYINRYPLCVKNKEDDKYKNFDGKHYVFKTSIFGWLKL